MSEDYSRRDYALDDPSSVQAGGVSSTVNDKKDGVEWSAKPSDDHEAKESQDSNGFDNDGIPEGI